MITSWSNFTFWKNKTIQARRKIGQIIKEIMNERREKRLATRDLLGYLLNFNDLFRETRETKLAHLQAN